MLREITILGPTASGKTSLSIELAKELTDAVIVTIVCDRGDRYLSTPLFD